MSARVLENEVRFTGLLSLLLCVSFARTESSEWSDGGDVLFGTDSEHEMSLTEREHI